MLLKIVLIYFNYKNISNKNKTQLNIVNKIFLKFQFSFL